MTTQYKQEWLELAEKYAALGTIEKAASEMGISYSTARDRLIRMEIPINAKGPASWRVILTGEECKAKRAELGMSQPELAKLSETTVVTISNFENGKRTPRAETQKKLAAALKMKSPEVSHSPSLDT